MKLELLSEFLYGGAINCYNTGNLTAKPTQISQYGGAAGISGGGANGGNIYNCYNSGTLKRVGTTGMRERTAVISKLNDVVIKNCYYLYGTQGTTGITPESAASVFYQTSNNQEDMTTVKVVAALNSYIESNTDGIVTTGWCKWVIGSNNLPALDFDTEWDGTQWVTTTN